MSDIEAGAFVVYVGNMPRFCDEVGEVVEVNDHEALVRYDGSSFGYWLPLRDLRHDYEVEVSDE